MDGGTVTLNNCDIYSNTASVSARLLELPLKVPPSPRWGARFH